MLFCKIFRVYELRIQPRGETSKGSGSKARALKQGLQKNKAKAGVFPSSDQALRPVCIVIVENLAKICKNDSRAQMGQKPKAGSIASFCHTRARPGSTLISSSLAGARQTWAHSTSNSAEPFVTRIWLQQKSHKSWQRGSPKGLFIGFRKPTNFKRLFVKLAKKCLDWISVQTVGNFLQPCGPFRELK